MKTRYENSSRTDGCSAARTTRTDHADLNESKTCKKQKQRMRSPSDPIHMFTSKSICNTQRLRIHDPCTFRVFWEPRSMDINTSIHLSWTLPISPWLFLPTQMSTFCQADTTVEHWQTSWNNTLCLASCQNWRFGDIIGLVCCPLCVDHLCTEKENDTWIRRVRDQSMVSKDRAS